MAIKMKQRVIQYLRSRTEEEGFTLVELIVEVMIIGILSAIAIPSFINNVEKAEVTGAQLYLHTAVKECQMKIAFGDPDPTYTLPPNTTRFQFPDSGDDGKCLSPPSGNIFTAARTIMGQSVADYALNINVVTGEKSTQFNVPSWITWEGIYSPILQK